MVMYMHVILFFICINLGLGFTAIPDTPLSIPNAGTANAMDCFTEGHEMMLVYDGATGEWSPSQNANQANNTPVQDMAGLQDYITDFGGNYDPITAAVDASYQTIDLVKGILLGGFITNTIDNMTFTCDWDEGSATFGQPVDNPVMSYFKGAISIIFGMMLFLAVLYLVTGKSFGI